MLRLVAAATLLIFPLGGTTLFRVACGSTSAVTDPAGNAWSKDSNFTGGTAWSQPSAPSEPYRHLRYAQNFSYFFQLPTLPAPATYNITLKFLEPNKTHAGQRLFNVIINGVTQLTQFDVYLLANGTNKPYDRSFPVTVGADGRLAIQFSPVNNQNAVISAIQIDSIDAAPAISGLAKCVGPTGPFSNCDGLWKVNVTLPDRTTLTIVGPNVGLEDILAAPWVTVK